MRTQVPASLARPHRLMTVLLVALLATSGLVAAGPSRPAAAYPAAAVELKGHGFGHGRGMGQYGALVFALAGSTYTQILE